MFLHVEFKGCFLICFLIWKNHFETFPILCLFWGKALWGVEHQWRLGLEFVVWNKWKNKMKTIKEESQVVVGNFFFLFSFVFLFLILVIFSCSFSPCWSELHVPSSEGKKGFTKRKWWWCVEKSPLCVEKFCIFF